MFSTPAPIWIARCPVHLKAKRHSTRMSANLVINYLYRVSGDETSVLAKQGQGQLTFDTIFSHG